MARPEQAMKTSRSSDALAALRLLKGQAGVFLGLLVFILVGLPSVPEATGLRFGVSYQLFFTAFWALAALFFWLLGKETVPSPKGALGVLSSLIGVYLVTVGSLVALGVVYPQFEWPRAAEEGQGVEASQRGKALFQEARVGCFLCHAIAGSGGTRGPDLTRVAARAGDRVPGLSAKEYLTEKVKAGYTYRFNVPEYAPIMPAFVQVLSEEQLADLVAYLLTLK